MYTSNTMHFTVLNVIHIKGLVYFCNVGTMWGIVVKFDLNTQQTEGIQNEFKPSNLKWIIHVKTMTAFVMDVLKNISYLYINLFFMCYSLAVVPTNDL